MTDFISFFEDDYDVVLIPDTRFPNEINTIVQKFFMDGVYTVWVERLKYDSKLTEEQKNHESENSLKEEDCNYYVLNDDIERLKYNCETMLDGIFWTEPMR